MMIINSEITYSILILGGSVCGLIICFFPPFLTRKRQQKRLSTLMVGEPPPLKNHGMDSPLKTKIFRQIDPANFSISRSGKGPYSLNSLVLQSVITGICAAIFCLVMILTMGPEHLTDWYGLLGILGSLIAAQLGPRLFERERNKWRQRQIQEGMPDLIDLLILCIDAGLSLDAALARTVGLMEKVNPALGREIQLTLDELSILPDRNQAFFNLQKRAGPGLVTYFVLAVNQTSQYGTPLSATLKTMSEENRRSVLLELERRANRLPVLLSLPLILLILPPVVCLSVGPGFILMLRGLGG